MSSGQKRIVLAAALGAAAVLGVAAYAEWNYLRNEWWRWQAIRDVRKPEFDPNKPPPASWSRIIAAGEAGFPALAKLLHDPDDLSSCVLVLGDETQRERVREFFKQHPDEHLARNLLWSGDLDTLGWMISNHQPMASVLAEFLYRLPPEEDIATWWAASKSLVGFDPVRRKFLVHP